MKYNININQKELSKYDLDLKEMAMFDYIQVMCSSVNSKIAEERFKGHTWINYERMIEDMPALRIKSRNSITPRINNLEKSGLVTVVRKMVSGHRRVFVKMTTLSDSVFVDLTERVRETVQDNNTNNNNTISKTKVLQGNPQIQELLGIFVNFDSLGNKNIYGKKTERNSAENLLTVATPAEWRVKLKQLTEVYTQPFFPANLVSYKPTEVERNLVKIRTWVNKNNKH